MRLSDMRKRKVVLAAALFIVLHGSIAQAVVVNRPAAGTGWITGNSVTTEVDFPTPHPYRVVITITNTASPSIEYFSHTDAPYTSAWPYSLNFLVPSNGTNEPMNCTLTATGQNFNGTANGAASQAITIKPSTNG